MAKRKSKSKFSSSDVSEQSLLHSSLSDISSSDTRSEKSIRNTNADFVKPSSETLKRRRHYQEFKRIYYSRLNQNKGKSNHGGKRHDSQIKWDEPMSSSRRRESIDMVRPSRTPRMTSSKITHKRSEKSCVEKLLNRLQKPADKPKDSCESVKLMYSAFASVQSKERNRPDSKYYQARKYDNEKRHHSDDRAKQRDPKVGFERERYRSRAESVYDKPDEEARGRREKPSRDPYRRHSLEEVDINKPTQKYDKYRKQKYRNADEEEEDGELSLEQEYYQKYHSRHVRDKDCTHKHREYDKYEDRNVEYKGSKYGSEKYDKYRNYDDDNYERKHKDYATQQQCKYRDLDEKEQKQKSGNYDRYNENDENERYNKSRRSERCDKYGKENKLDKHRQHDKYDKEDKYDKQRKQEKCDTYEKYEKDRPRQRFEREHEVNREDSRQSLVKHRSRKYNNYVDNENYETMERLERFILEKRFGSYPKQVHYKENHGETKDYYRVVYDRNKQRRVRDTSVEQLVLEERRSSYTSQKDVYERNSSDNACNKLKKNVETEMPSMPTKKTRSLEVIPSKSISETGEQYQNIDDNLEENEYITEAIFDNGTDKQVPENNETLNSQLVNDRSPKYQQLVYECQQRLLIEQESQCANVEKKSQAIETKMLRGISPLRSIKHKPEKKSNVKYESHRSQLPQESKLANTAGKANSLGSRETPAAPNNSLNIRKRQLQSKREPPELVKLNNSKIKNPVKGYDKRSRELSPQMRKDKDVAIIKGTEKNNLENVTEGYRPDNVFERREAPSSLLSTLSKMEERAIKTLETLKDAEKKILEERIGEINSPSTEDRVHAEIERHLKIIEEITRKQLVSNQKEPLDRGNYTDQDNLLTQQLTMEENSTRKDQVDKERIASSKVQDTRRGRSPNREGRNGESPRENVKKRDQVHGGYSTKGDDGQGKGPKYSRVDKRSPVRNDRNENLKHGKDERLKEVKRNIPNREEEYFENKSKSGKKEETAGEDMVQDENDIIVEESRNADWKDVNEENLTEKNLCSNWTVSKDKDGTGEEEETSDLNYAETDQKHAGNLKDTIQEEDIEEIIGNEINRNNQGGIKGNDEEARKQKGMEPDEEKAFIKEPVLLMNSDSSSAALTSRPNSKVSFYSTKIVGSTPIYYSSIHSIPGRNLNISRLPIKTSIKAASSTVTAEPKQRNLPETRSYHEQFSLYAQKLLDIYRANAYESEELVEKLKRVVNLQKTPGPSQQNISPTLSQRNSITEKPVEQKLVTRQEVKKENQKTKKVNARCNKIKEDKKEKRSQSPKKQNLVKGPRKIEVEKKLSVEEKALQEAINLFSTHKSTLSLVRGEMMQLEQKINVLLDKRSEKRNQTNQKKSKIPRRIK